MGGWGCHSECGEVYCLAESTFAFSPSVSDETSVSLECHCKEKGREGIKEVSTESEGPGEANCFDFSIYRLTGASKGEGLDCNSEEERKCV